LKSDAGARHREFQKLLRRFLVVCETMAYAHSRGIIHRDLKPRNIMLGPYGETLVVDWGLAKIVGRPETALAPDATLRPLSGSAVQPTAVGSRVGTPGFMSPEQARGEVDHLGPATDIYSLGATLYYILTKQAPFTDHDLPEVLFKIERGEFPSPRDVKSGVDRALEAICLKAMETRPEDRYVSCRLMADDIEHWLADQPVSAYPEPFAVSAMRRVRRQKQWVAAASLLAFSGLIGLALHDIRLGQEQTRTKTALENLAHEQALTKQALDDVGHEQVRTNQALDRAAEQLQMTRTALRDLLSVAGTKLANIPRAESLRGELAGRVLEYYKKLLAQFPEDSNILYEMARVYRVIAIIDRVTGQTAQSEKAFQQSIEIFEKLADDRSRTAEVREWLVQTMFDRGGLYYLSGNTQKAEQAYRSAVARGDALLSRGDSITYLRIKGELLINLSDILALRGQSPEAYALADEGVGLLDQAVRRGDEKSAGDQARWLLANALTTRGIRARKTPARKTAEQDFQRSVEVSEKIPQGSVYFTSAQLQMSLALNELGRLFSDEAPNYLRAKQAFDRSIQIIDPLAKESSHYPYYRKALGAALAGRSAVYGADELVAAQKDCDQGVAILTEILRSEPENPNYLSQQAEALELAAQLARRRNRKSDWRKLIDAAIAQLEHAVRIDSNRVSDSEKLARYKATRSSMQTD
jgi:eukaryotic-like serine/threonine-protein kinase